MTGLQSGFYGHQQHHIEFGQMSIYGSIRVYLSAMEACATGCNSRANGWRSGFNVEGDGLCTKIGVLGPVGIFNHQVYQACRVHGSFDDRHPR